MRSETISAAQALIFDELASRPRSPLERRMPFSIDIDTAHFRCVEFAQIRRLNGLRQAASSIDD
jgi:hypothetical protein